MKMNSTVELHFPHGLRLLPKKIGFFARSIVVIKSDFELDFIKNSKKSSYFYMASGWENT